MQDKADKYEEMLKSISFSSETKYEEAKDQNGCVLAKFPKAISCCVTVKVKEMIKAAGFEFSDMVDWNIVE